MPKHKRNGQEPNGSGSDGHAAESLQASAERENREAIEAAKKTATIITPTNGHEQARDVPSNREFLTTNLGHGRDPAEEFLKFPILPDTLHWMTRTNITQEELIAYLAIMVRQQTLTEGWVNPYSLITAHAALKNSIGGENKEYFAKVLMAPGNMLRKLSRFGGFGDMMGRMGFGSGDNHQEKPGL